jgi:hypothetical protein
MSWKNVKKFDGKIGPGEKKTLYFNFGKGDPGGGDFAQYIMANPLTVGGELQTSQSKRKNDDGSVTYTVTFTNIGDIATEVDFAGIGGPIKANV